MSRTNNKLRIGIVGAGAIVRDRHLPGLKKHPEVEIVAVSNSTYESAEKFCQENAPHATPMANWADLLSVPELDIIWIGTPPYMHSAVTVSALEAGKHVLCEKPLSVTVAEAKSLLAVQERTGVIIAEDFMVHGHPQWLRAHDLIGEGRIGNLRSIQGVFSYFNTDPANIRNVPEYGGGSLMDIGCYPIHTSRWMFGEEPVRVMGLFDRDPQFKVDRLTSAMLEFPSGHAVFTCSMQLVYHQQMQLLGTRGRIEMAMPFTPPPDRPSHILIDDGRDLAGSGIVLNL